MEQKHLSQQNVAISTGSGSPIGLFESSYTGQIYRDTSVTLNNLWMSVGHPSNTLWVPISGIPDSLIHYSEISGTLNSRTNYLVKRTVVTGLKATFEILITTDGMATINVNNVIPLNFLNKKYFKINRYTHIIKRLVKHVDKTLMTGTYSTVNGNPSASPATMATVVGVGTLFLSEFKVGDRITNVSSGGSPSGSGYVTSIQSDTQMTLGTSSPLQVASGDPVYVMFGVGHEGFTKVDFNDLLNTYSTDLNNTTGFDLKGGTVGQLSQFEGSLGMTSEMPKDDATPLTGMEYATGYAPKDLSLAALNMVYNPKVFPNGTAVPAHDYLGNDGTSDGDFHIVLEGYLL